MQIVLEGNMFGWPHIWKFGPGSGQSWLGVAGVESSACVGGVHGVAKGLVLNRCLLSCGTLPIGCRFGNVAKGVLLATPGRQAQCDKCRT